MAPAALAGAGGLVVVQGEPGIGKTRLVAEVLDRLRPIRVGAGKCAEADRDLPYVPLAAALRDLGAPTLPQAASLRALGEILPELPAADLPPETARIRALESVTSLLRDLAPVALFIDDLQWADASTVGALAYLTRRCAAQPVLLLGALRPEEVEPGDAVAGLDASERVTLRPLVEADLEPLGAGSAARLLSLSGGLPLWLAELVRAGDDGAGTTHWQRSRRLARHPASWPDTPWRQDSPSLRCDGRCQRRRRLSAPGRTSRRQSTTAESVRWPTPTRSCSTLPDVRPCSSSSAECS